MESLLRNKKIESVQEDSSYDEYLADLKPGWCFEDIGVHSFGFETLKEGKDCLKWVKPCNCSSCKGF